MGTFIALSQTLSEVMDRLALGFEMFGHHAIWFWLLPPIWGIAACMIWTRMERDEEERERLYVADAERNLPRLTELANHRSIEILDIRSKDRRIRQHDGQG